MACDVEVDLDAIYTYRLLTWLGRRDREGVDELLEVITSAFPSPLEHPMPEATTLEGRPVTDIAVDARGPLVAEVVTMV